MQNFNWCWLCVGKVGCFGWFVFCVFFYDTIFSKADLKTQIIFLPSKQNLEKYFHRQHILHKYFPSSILKINLCTSKRTILQQRDKGLFCYFALIFFSVCIDILRCWQHFFSHVATFPYPSRLNHYLAENMTLLSSIIEPSPNSNPLNTCLAHWYKATVELDYSKLILYIPAKSVI